ncbi:MAG: bifunctional folylpolyglutamate synthase/dihydrofolate synthase [Deltaproteobacteria bacterium]|nr:bifunctional folylpolyglutamate synthase/dihydrofolate synthase [Deltaproteobacteria bacterium]
MLLTQLLQSSKTEWQHMKPGLERIQAVCEEFGNPQKKFPSIHIAGTNGKGSTAAMLQSILTQAGYKVGLFTSPHLVKINERFRIGYEDISDKRLEELLSSLFPLPSSLLPLSFFELCSLLTFLYFTQEKVEFAILEVGLGGKLDSTNIITPLISVITEISLDHTEFLGPDLASIAKEKAGIIKPGVPVVCGATDPAVIEVIQKIAQANKAPLFFPSPLEGEGVRRTGEGQITLPLLGIHQQKNAAIVLKTIEILQKYEAPEFALTNSPLSSRGGIKNENILVGLQKTQWPGRLEVVQKKPLIILDGAHNVAGIKAVVDFLSQTPSPLAGEGYNWKILFCAASDKNVEEMLRELSKLSGNIYLCKMENPRSIDPEGGLGGCKDAYLHLSNSLKEHEALLVTGSLYLVGEIKKGQSHS